jgi:hypothetical protein
MTPTVCVFNRTRESFLCLSAIAAGTLPTPRGNFRGFDEVARRDGIWLTAPTGVYVVGTRFPEDRVYLDRGNRVIDLIEHLEPLQMVPVRYRHASVLELPARTIYSSRTRVGDELLICSAEEVETHWKGTREQFPDRRRERSGERTRVQTAWTKQEVIPCSKG